MDTYKQGEFGVPVCTSSPFPPHMSKSAFEAATQRPSGTREGGQGLTCRRPGQRSGGGTERCRSRRGPQRAGGRRPRQRPGCPGRRLWRPAPRTACAGTPGEPLQRSLAGTGGWTRIAPAGPCVLLSGVSVGGLPAFLHALSLSLQTELSIMIIVVVVVIIIKSYVFICFALI